MATPWGDSPYPPVSSRPAGPRHPSFAPPTNEQGDPVSINVSPPGFTFPAPNHVARFPQPMPPSGALPFPSGPVPAQMPIPMILRPGADPTSPPPILARTQSHSYFFEPPGVTHMQHAVPSPRPPLPRKPEFNAVSTSVPVPIIPPKPVAPPEQSSPQVPPRPHQTPSSWAPPPGLPPSNLPIVATASSRAAVQVSSSPMRLPSDTEQDGTLKRILALSARESEERHKTLEQEDEDLARALEESLAVAQARPRSLTVPTLQSASHRHTSSIASPGDIAVSFWSPTSSGTGTTESALTPASSVQYTPDLSPNIPQSDDASRYREDGSSTHSPLAEEAPLSQGHGQTSVAVSAPANMSQPPPQYDEIGPSTRHDPRQVHSSQDALLQTGSTPVLAPALGRSVSAQPVSSSQVGFPDLESRRAQSFAGAFRPVQDQTRDGSPQAQLKVPASGTLVDSKPATSIDDSVEPSHAKLDVPHLKERRSFSSIQAPASGVVLPASHYIDKELLQGVSLGFGVPSMTTSLAPYEGVIPNVVALPYGRCPPFHMRAPSWRILLQLMARMSNSRLQPTVEAMAVIKTEMKLRGVIAFVRVHQSSPDWHTILYLTIDDPVPPNMPNAWKYKNGDTCTLPWSYTLSPCPPFLRDGADAGMSKFYTIPSTQNTPYPTLPISFPDLAVYLARALQESRAASHDGSGGLRRLARSVDSLYPDISSSERTGMKQKIKSLVGIGSRPTRDRNAETYDLVTPFWADDFGR